MSATKSCICIISHYPQKEWVNFLSRFSYYDAYITIDDNSLDCKQLYNSNNVTVIQDTEANCEETGFKHLISELHPTKPISGWEKSLYYFSYINPNYNYVWFLEADTFFYGEETLLKIDQLYENRDLLYSNLFCNETGKLEPSDWKWLNIHTKTPIRIPPPWYAGLPGALRMSNSLIKSIKEYAREQKTLFYLEAAFPTICIANKLTHSIIRELSSVWWIRDRYDTHDITDVANHNNFIHPVKNMDEHIFLRKRLDDVLKAKFKKIAKEGEEYFFKDEQKCYNVAYGSKGQYHYRWNVKHSVVFNNQFFGDPFPGSLKSGYLIEDY